MQGELKLDYIDALKLHLEIIALLHFDKNGQWLSNREKDFLLLCMHIKLQGHKFQSDEAFALMDLNGWQNSKYLYWNDRIYPKGWFTGKLYKDKLDSDLTPLLGIQTGKSLKNLKYNLIVTIDQYKNEKGTDIFEAFHKDFAQRHNISEDHLKHIIASVWNGARYYVETPECPIVDIPHIGKLKASPGYIAKVLKNLAQDYFDNSKPQSEKIIIREKFIALNRVRRRRILERYFKTISLRKVKRRYEKYKTN